jgi:hypothetical protein
MEVRVSRAAEDALPPGAVSQGYREDGMPVRNGLLEGAVYSIQVLVYPLDSSPASASGTESAPLTEFASNHYFVYSQ